METLQKETFNICGGKLTFTLIDLDYVIRYNEKGETGRLVSARTLRDLLNPKGNHLFLNFVNRAYRDGDETVCKLRSGIRVSFSMRWEHSRN